MTPMILEEFIQEVFGNILELLECNRRLLEVLYVRQREQHPVIQNVGDIFLEAATEFRTVYPAYVGHHPLAEKRMKDELENNPEFRLFIEVSLVNLINRNSQISRRASCLEMFPPAISSTWRESPT